MTPPLLRLAVAIGSILLLAGCGTTPARDGARTGPFYKPANVRAVERLPAGLRRIVLLPCAAVPALTEPTLRDLDRTLATTLTAAARAEVVPLADEQAVRLAGRPRILSTATLPAGFLGRIARETGADAILLVDVTAYSPYPPLVLGLRARLVLPGTGEDLWNFDNIVSTTDPAVVNSARARALRRTPASGSPGDLSHTVLQNPLDFAGYVAEATWQTLPPR